MLLNPVTPADFARADRIVRRDEKRLDVLQQDDFPEHSHLAHAEVPQGTYLDKTPFELVQETMRIALEQSVAANLLFRHTGGQSKTLILPAARATLIAAAHVIVATIGDDPSEIGKSVLRVHLTDLDGHTRFWRDLSDATRQNKNGGPLADSMDNFGKDVNETAKELDAAGIKPYKGEAAILKAAIEHYLKNALDTTRMKTKVDTFLDDRFWLMHAWGDASNYCHGRPDVRTTREIVQLDLVALANFVDYAWAGWQSATTTCDNLRQQCVDCAGCPPECADHGLPFTV